MLKLNIISISIVETSLVLTNSLFPEEDYRVEWVQTLLSLIGSEIIQVEDGADIQQFGFGWNKYLFILTISDTVQSIWINASNRDPNAIVTLHNQLSEKLSSKIM